jgi:hypothetical protein
MIVTPASCLIPFFAGLFGGAGRREGLVSREEDQWRPVSLTVLVQSGKMDGL